MDYNDFAQKIKEKYPQYNSVDNYELASKMVQKYPDYASQVNLQKTDQGALSKVGSAISSAADTAAGFVGGKQLAQGIGQTISNVMGGQNDLEQQQASMNAEQADIQKKIKAGRAAGQDVSGLVKALQAGTAGQQQLAGSSEDVGTGGLTNRQVLGSAGQLATNIGSTALPGAGQLVKGTGLGAAAARTAIAAGQGAVTGAASGATSEIAQGGTNEDVANATKRAGIAGAIFGGATQGVSEGYQQLGNLFSNSGKKISTSVIKPTLADMKDGFNVDNVRKYGVDGSLEQTLEKTNNKMGELRNQLNERLAGSDSKINLDDIYAKTVADLKGTTLKQFGTNTRTGAALDDLSKEIEALKGEGGAHISIPDAQTVKQAAGAQGAWQFGRNDPESTAREAVYNQFYRNIKDSIEKNSPEGVQDINKQLSELIPIRNAVIRRIPVANRNNAIGLGEIVSLAHGITNPSSLALSGVTLASKSGNVGRALSNAGQAIGNTSGAVQSAVNAVKPAIAPVAAKVGTQE